MIFNAIEILEVVDEIKKIQKMVKFSTLSSVATSEVHNCESRVKTNCHKYSEEHNTSEFRVLSDHAHHRHHPTYQHIYATAFQQYRFLQLDPKICILISQR